MSEHPLSPDLERFKPVSLEKKTRSSVVTVVMDAAIRKKWVARCLQLPPGGAEGDLLQGIDRAAHQLKSIAPHPNLPAFHGIVEGAGGTWMLFDHEPGTLLSQYVSRESAVPDEWIGWWLYHTLQGLNALHTQTPPIIVGYLEPSDVVVRDHRLWIVDLGLFEDMFPEKGAVWLQDHPFANFIAPERRNMAHPAPQSDLFSAGALAFWLLTGRAPVVPSQAVADQMRQVVAASRPALPEAVVTLVVSLLSFYPSHRPATAREAMEQLAPWVADKTGQSVPPGMARDELFAAASTRGIQPKVVQPPPAVVYENTPLQADPALPPAQEFLEDARWALRLRPWTAAGMLATLCAIAVWVTVALLARHPQPGPVPLLQVKSGHVLTRVDAPGAHWSPLTRIPAGTTMASTDEMAVLQFGSSEVDLAPGAIVACLGCEGKQLILSLQKGGLSARTVGADTVLVKWMGAEVAIGHQSQASVGPDQVLCRWGQVEAGGQALPPGNTWTPHP